MLILMGVFISMVIIVLVEQHKMIKVSDEAEVVFEQLQIQTSLNRQLTKDMETLTAQIELIVNPSYVQLNGYDIAQVTKLIKLKVRIQKRSSNLTSYDKISFEIPQFFPSF